jgi:hypothetical protein
MSSRVPEPTRGNEKPRSPWLRARYRLTPKSCPTRAGRLKAATSRAMSGQTSRSKALMRHGADPGVALAGVLGVSAGDVLLNDGSE